MRTLGLVIHIGIAVLVANCATAKGGDDDDDVVSPDADPNRPDGQGPFDAAPDQPDAQPLGTPCDAILQDCRPGQKCALIVTDTGAQTGYTGCWTNGNRGIGQSCDNPTEADTADDCVAGSHCVFGTCHEICRLDPEVACSDGGCVGVNNLDDQFDICLPSCDPLAPDCTAGEGCYLLAQGAVCAPVIGSGVPPHGSCGSVNECQAGSGCFNDPGECLSYCDYGTYPNLNDPIRCAGGELCGKIMGEDVVGVCVIP